MSTIHKRDWILFLLLTVLLITVRLPAFDEPLDNDSGANAFFSRQMLRGKTLYDVFHPAHQFPGIYYTFELAFGLFGDNPNAPKLLLFPWALACALLLYLMGRMYFDEQTGRVAAIFFILVSSQRWLAGMTVEMEHFANLPLIVGFFLLIVLFRRQAPAWQFIWLGILSALCILYKVIFVAPLLVAGILILLMAWITRKEARAWKTMLSRLNWMTIGLIIPLALVAAYFASLGLWKRFMLVFEFGFNYFDDPQIMNASNLPAPFGFPLYWISVNNIALLCFGLIGTYRLARRSIPIRTTDNLTDLAMVLWLVVSFALAGLRGGGFAYYVLPVLPPLALIASIEISTAYQGWKTSSEKLANLGRGASIVLVIGLFLWSNYSIYRDYLMYKLARISYANFLQSVGEEEFASWQISNYVKAHTKPDDFIYIWGNRVESYYYADRLPPIDMLWPYYVGATGSPNRIFDPSTKYIVVDEPEKIDRPQWLLDGIAANYELETIIDDREIYRRVQ
ncbi:MAG TPA: hypothetical protein VK249_23970 [Anaerolineales bacterium]|nr:hypothetical protein [Anaerolineales bacterium]